MAKCKSCGAEIIWALTVAGRRMPVDVSPADRGGGSVLLVAMGNPSTEPEVGAHGWLALMVASVTEGERGVIERSSGILHDSHFATCPNAAEHRKPRAA